MRKVLGTFKEEFSTVSLLGLLIAYPLGKTILEMAASAVLALLLAYWNRKIILNNVS